MASRKTAKNTDSKHTNNIVVVLPNAELKAQLKAMADADRRSLSAYCALVLEDFVNDRASKAAA